MRSLSMSGTNDRSALVLMGLVFVVFGTVWGVWAVCLADILNALQLGPAEAGAAMVAVSATAIPVMLGAGALSSRISVNYLLVAGVVVFVPSFIGLGLANSLVTLVLAFIAMGAGSGLIDLVTNAKAMTYELRTGRPVITFLYAGVSFGAAVGAIASGAVLNAGLSYSVVLTVAALFQVALLLLLPVPGGKPSRPASEEARANGGEFRLWLIVALGIAMALAFLSESGMEQWAAVYLRNSLGLAALVGGTGVAAYNLAMLCGRLLGAGLVNRFGASRVLIGSGLAASVGMGVSIATTIPALIVVGFVGVGLALSCIAPTAMSFAGRLSGGKAPQASSIVITAGYFGFLIGPAIMGGLADVTGLRWAFLVIVVTGLVIAALSATIVRLAR